jgi:exopolyphosphatase/guanosine-5'-triphosphate,3'-diphosphate pyrophosphatase
MPARAHIRKPAEKRAAIDIGSNSVKLLIARVKDRCVSPIIEKSTQTRLNKGLREGGDFNSASVRSTHRLLRGYVELCIQHQTLPPLLFATSAARNASLKSLQNLLQPLWKEFGLSIQVISPFRKLNGLFEEYVLNVIYRIHQFCLRMWEAEVLNSSLAKKEN